MTRKKEDPSPALAFLRIAWAENCKSVQHSWDRVNGGMRQAFALAISIGLRWNAGDLEYIAATFRTCRWMDWESMYSLAVCERNTDYAKLYEAYMARLPIIADNVDSPGSTLAHSSGFTGCRERLFVGATFDYKLVRPTVTSFREDGTVVACTYCERPYQTHDEKMADIRLAWPTVKFRSKFEKHALAEMAYQTHDDYSPQKIFKRFILGRDDIIADRANRK